MQRTEKSKLPWGLSLLVTLVICVFALVAALIIKNSSGGMSFGEYRTFALPANQGVETIGDGFVYYNGSSLSFVNTSAKSEWTYMVGANASFDASDTGVAVWSGKLLTLLNSKDGSTNFSGTMESEVLSAKTGSKFSAVLLGPEQDSTVVLLENGGRQVDSIRFQHQTVVDYGFFSNGSLFWVMTLDTSGTVPVCSISTYKPGKMIVGSIRDTEQLLYHVMFQSSHVCGVGMTHLKIYDYTGVEDPARRQLVYGWYMAECEDDVDNPLMAFVPDAQITGGDTIHDVRLIRANVDQIVRMPYGCSSLVSKDDRLYGLSTDGKIMVAQTGKQKVDAFNVDIFGGTLSGVTNDHIAVVTTPNMAYLVQLP